jgi:hypothetical protein
MCMRETFDQLKLDFSDADDQAELYSGSMP